MKRVAVFFLSVKSDVGMRNLVTPSGVFSRFTNPFARRMCLNKAFCNRSDNLQYFAPTRIVGNWSSTPPFVGWNHDTYDSAFSSKCIISLEHGSFSCGHGTPSCTRSVSFVSISNMTPWFNTYFNYDQRNWFFILSPMVCNELVDRHVSHWIVSRGLTQRLKSW